MDAYDKFEAAEPKLREGINLTIRGLRMQLEVWQLLPPDSTFAVCDISRRIEFWESQKSHQE